MAPTRIHQANLVVHDVRASRTFYERLGLDFVHERDAVWAEHHACAPQPAPSVQAAATGSDLDLDSTSFVAKWHAGWPGGTGTVLGFKVDTREAVDERVTALETYGVAVQQHPCDAFWGPRYAVASDPDGNAVGIMSSVDPERRSELPAPG